MEQVTTDSKSGRQLTLSKQNTAHHTTTVYTVHIPDMGFQRLTLQTVMWLTFCGISRQASCLRNVHSDQ